MGGRKKRRKAIPKVIRRIPRIFLCPNCSRQAFSITLTPIEGTDYNKAEGRCGECGLRIRTTVPRLYQPVDAYGKMIDIFEGFKGDIEEVIGSGKYLGEGEEA